MTENWGQSPWGWMCPTLLGYRGNRRQSPFVERALTPIFGTDTLARQREDEDAFVPRRCRAAPAPGRRHRDVLPAVLPLVRDRHGGDVVRHLVRPHLVAGA